MTRICHLFDETAGWEQRIGAWQLLDRLDRDGYHQDVAVLGGDARGAVASLGKTTHTVERIGPLDFISAPLVRRLLDRLGADVIHAWGARAAKVAAAATDRPIVVELFDPSKAAQHAKVIRSLARSIGLGIVCGSERLRRLLTEHGVPLERSTVVRPGVDFAQINQVQRSGLREALGLSPDDFVVAVPPLSALDGQFDAAVGVTLLARVEPRARLLVWGGQPIQRFARQAIGDQAIGCSGTACPFEHLIAVADAMVIAARKEVSTTAIAWAMAANTALVAPATYAVAELIASGLNGMLFKPEPARSAAVQIARLLRDRPKQNRLKEVARGHAYEVFGLRRRVDQVAQVYRNVVAGIAAGEGIVDSAVAG